MQFFVEIARTQLSTGPCDLEVGRLISQGKARLPPGSTVHSLRWGKKLSMSGYLELLLA